MIRIIEIERHDDGDKEKPIATVDAQNGLAEFHAQLMCNALNRQIGVDSRRYYKVEIVKPQPAIEQEAA